MRALGEAKNPEAGGTWARRGGWGGGCPWRCSPSPSAEGRHEGRKQGGKEGRQEGGQPAGRPASERAIGRALAFLMWAAMSFSMLYFSRACVAHSTESCCISSDMSAFLITAFRSHMAACTRGTGREKGAGL